MRFSPNGNDDALFVENFRSAGWEEQLFVIHQFMVLLVKQTANTSVPDEKQEFGLNKCSKALCDIVKKRVKAYY